jgi:hypothetical protein
MKSLVENLSELREGSKPTLYSLTQRGCDHLQCTLMHNFLVSSLITIAEMAMNIANFPLPLNFGNVKKNFL